MLEWDNSPRTIFRSVFDYYSPEQFYMINKIILNGQEKIIKKKIDLFLLMHGMNGER